MTPGPAASETPAKRVLVVDDDPDIRELVVLSLELAGWEPIEAPDGHQAIALAATIDPDAILLDVMMPGMDGPGTLAALRARPETQDIPVVFLTAKTLTPQRSLTDYDVCGIIEKPFGPSTLPSAVARLVGWV